MDIDELGACEETRSILEEEREEVASTVGHYWRFRGLFCKRGVVSETQELH